MLRGIVGVIVGFLMMAAIVIVTTIGIVWLAPGFVTDPDSSRPTVGFYLYSFATGLFAALAGGFMCAFIAERPVRGPILALVSVAVLLGCGEMVASQVMTAADATTPVSPLWYQAVILLIAVTGLLLAGRLSGRWTRADR